MSDQTAPVEDLQAGDGHYKAYIGPPVYYDILGASQFNLFTSMGMRDKHKMLDIGCGSLRAGKFFISYLLKGNYYGIEPNAWLVQDGIKSELGEGIKEIKAPTFHHSDQFDLTHFNEKFDYMNAQSVFSHASGAQIDKCLGEAKKVLNPEGMFICNFRMGPVNYTGDEWVYPGTVTFNHQFIVDICAKHGLKCVQTRWSHANKLVWYVICHEEHHFRAKQLVNQLFLVNKTHGSYNWRKGLGKFSLFNNGFTKKVYYKLKYGKSK